jgi:hypothetical protein
MKWIKAFAALTLVGMAGGCAFNGGTEDGDAVASEAEALTQLVGPISEEAGINEVSCPIINSGVTGAQCKGSKCDNNYMQCSTLPTGTGWFGNSYVTRWFSEEGSPTENFAICDGGTGNSNIARGVVMGLAASGSFSDNLRLRCKPIIGRFTNCKWQDFFSEEQGSQPFAPFGSYAVGLRCKGPNCDEVSYATCQILPP